MKNKITFILFAFNEESRIQYPIECFLPFGDVLVVDNFSVDKTVEIATRCGAKVIQYDNSKNMGIAECSEEASFVFQHVNTEWVFWGYVDEMIPKVCLELYLDLTQTKSPYKIIVQKHKTMLYDPSLEFMPANVVIRLFKVGAIEFLPAGTAIHSLGRISKNVRKEELYFLPPVDQLSIHHFSVYTTEKLTNTHNRYSNFHAKLMLKEVGIINIIFKPIIVFLFIYLIQGSWRKGILGFIVARQYSNYIFQVLCKAYEINNKIDSNSIEEKFKSKKLLMLSNMSEENKIGLYDNLKSWILSRLYIARNF